MEFHIVGARSTVSDSKKVGTFSIEVTAPVDTWIRDRTAGPIRDVKGSSSVVSADSRFVPTCRCRQHSADAVAGNVVKTVDLTLRMIAPTRGRLRNFSRYDPRGRTRGRSRQSRSRLFEGRACEHGSSARP